MKSLTAVSVFIENIFSNVISLLVASAELIMLLAALASSALKPGQKWRRTPICLAVVAAPVAFGRILFPQAIASSDNFYRFMLSRVFHNEYSSEYNIICKPRSIDSAITVAFKVYGWLFVIGIIVLLTVLLAFMFHRSFKVAHSFGRLLALGISAYFGVRFVLLVLTTLGLINGLSFNVPFLTFGGFSYLADALLAGVFLSVWRRSSFMPRDAVLAAAALPSRDAFPAQPVQ